MTLHEQFEVRAAVESGEGLVVVHESCGETVCAVEPGDKLSSLTLLAYEHACPHIAAATATARGIVAISPADIAFLDAVSAGRVHHLGGHYVHSTITEGAPARKLTARATRLRAYIDLYATPVPPGARFPDRYVVGLTELGHAALASAPIPSTKDR